MFYSVIIEWNPTMENLNLLTHLNFFVILSLYILGKLKIVKDWFKTRTETKIEAAILNNEHTFFSALLRKQKMWLINEEETLQKVYKIHRMPTVMLEKLKNSQRGDRVFRDSPYYDILSDKNE